MPLSPENYLRCLSDAFTPVRAADGRLLGCVPRVADDAVMHGPFPIMLAAQACVAVDLDDVIGRNVATNLPGFIPLDDTQTDLALAAPGTDDNADIGESV